ncbi:hypothetical protein [Burkholderia cenocepacia]|uniref:Uncharacterized protein n=1 Tax=Burkholderia cenocepacia TaxID=95486 RepID=A0A1V2VVC4_9BURK|nr:hypothetical protein [Burkholderia cenocepacia]ONU48699.1 hypothetical protein A8E66_03725 [Burkholderia cenocepacia]ONU49923.1 hypothetical protein A8E67_38695 [Burkholderia cenocepacia]ONU51639.1 hypothetical protein A8E62_25745 [Burkholderia cenocepacia]ONU53365.1 hypothetical protein A8E68_36635 [Burkholderia cenocepacia]ONU77427.1 hypothetical protein A8E72_31675 [Burkholderia cenocepacia]
MPDDNYTTIHLDDFEAERRALEIIKAHLAGLPVGQARRVLKRAEFWIDATTIVDCDANEFQRAYEELQRAGSESS